MKKFNMKLKIRRLSAALLSYAVAATAFLTIPFVASAESLADFANVYDAYYSSNMQSVDPTSEDMTNHWGLSSDETRLVHNTTDSNWQKCGPNMAILYLKETYNNFYLTTKFSLPKDDNGLCNLYFGIGAEKGKSWATDTSSQVFAIHHSGGLLNGKTGSWITGGGQTPSDKISGYNVTGVHTLQLRVLDKVYTAWVDGIQVGSGTLSNYAEGYIWFGADDMATSWGIPAVSNPNLISDFENIYDSYYTSNMKSVDPTPEAMTNHWGLTTDTTRLSRKTNDSSWTRFGPNMAILYLKKAYNNFDLTTTFSIPGNSDYDVYFGIGAEKGKSWADDSDSIAFTLHRSGGLVSGKAENWITGGGQTPADKITGYNSTGVHTLRLKVVDKVYTAWVDDIQVGNGTLSTYTEGYVWFGADDMTATWGIPAVTELKSISDYESVYDAYYSEDLTTADPTPVDIRTQWEVDNSKLYRKAFGDQWNSDTVKNVSLLYYNARKYYNFELETKFSHITNLDNLVAFFGFGAEKGVSWENNKGDTVLTVNPQFGAIINAKSAAVGGSWVSGTNEILKAQDPNYDMNAVHTLKIRMEDRNYTVWIDGYKVDSGRNAAYAGGYIYFGSNAYKTYFDIPTVTELPNTELLKYDVNGDNKLDSGDVIFLRKVLLEVEEANVKCDINDDKKLNILDLIAIKKVLA